MLDIKLIRKERERVEALLRSRDPDLSLERVWTLDVEHAALKREAEDCQRERNELSKEIGERLKRKEDAAASIGRVHQITERLKEIEQRLAVVEGQLHDALSRLPNLPANDVKVDLDPKHNVIIKEVGCRPTFAFTPKNHLELNDRLGLFDFERAAKTSGSGWPAYRDRGARLEWALINMMIDIQLAHGFTMWMPPLLVKHDIMFGSGQIPKFEGQYYRLEDGHQPLYLIPTAEVVLNGLHYDEILPQEALPMKYFAYTPCFRREAGAAGEKERGLIRVHQFNKVEMFCFTHPEQSEAMMSEMLGTAEEILQALGLHYRLSLLVTGDMSFAAAKTIDVEVWLPGQNRYYEVSSISNCTDYQARRSRIRFKNKQGKTEWVHTLNGSGLATSRLLVALLENCQTEAGDVRLPPILQERMGAACLSK